MRRTLNKRVERIEATIPKRHDPNERLPRDFVERLHRVYGKPGTVPTEADYAMTRGDGEAAIERAYAPQQ